MLLKGQIELQLGEKETALESLEQSYKTLKLHL